MSVKQLFIWGFFFVLFFCSPGTHWEALRSSSPRGIIGLPCYQQLHLAFRIRPCQVEAHQSSNLALPSHSFTSVCVRPEHKKKKEKGKKRSNNAAGVAYLSQQFDVLLFDWIHNSRFQEDLASKLKGVIFRGLDLTERSAWCVFIVNVFGFIVSMPLKYS